MGILEALRVRRPPFIPGRPGGIAEPGELVGIEGIPGGIEGIAEPVDIPDALGIGGIPGGVLGGGIYI